MRLVLAMVLLSSVAATSRADTYAGGAMVTLPRSKLAIQLPAGGSWTVEADGNSEVLNLLGTTLLVGLGPLGPSSCGTPPNGQRIDPPPPYVPPGGVSYVVDGRTLSCYQLAAGTLVVVTQIPPEQTVVAQTLLAAIVAAASAQTPAAPHRVTLIGTGLDVEVPGDATIQHGTGSFDMIQLAAHQAAVAVQYKDPCTIPPAMTRAIDPAFWPDGIAVYATTSPTEVLAVACAPTARGTVEIAMDYTGGNVRPEDAAAVRAVVAAVYAAIPQPAEAPASASGSVQLAPATPGSRLHVIADATAYIGFMSGETNAGFEHGGVHDNGGVAVDIPVGASIGLGVVGRDWRGFELIGAWRRVTTMKPWSSYVLTPAYAAGLWRVGPDLGSLDGQRVLGVSAEWLASGPHPSLAVGGRVAIDRISDALDDQASWLASIEFCLGFGVQ